MSRLSTRLVLPLTAAAIMTSISLGSLFADMTPVLASGSVTSTNTIDPNAVFTLQSSDQLSALAPQNDAAGNTDTGNDVPVVQDQNSLVRRRTFE